MVYTDLLFFLGILPVSVLLSFFDRSTEYKNLILILTSLVFFSWGRPFAVCIMFLTVFAEWGFGLWIEKQRENDRSGLLPLVLDLVMNAAVLIVVTRRFLYVTDDVFGFAKIIIPLSVGFYVLKGFLYTYGVYCGKAKAEKNVLCLMTYMWAYFLLPVGADVGYAKAAPQIRARKLELVGLSEGLTAFICGLSKVVIIAYPLKKIGEAGIKSEQLSTIGVLAGAAAMVGFAYFLFTGFCDMSYGLGRIYGFDFGRNYAPLTAKGVYGGVLKNTNVLLANLCSDISSRVSKSSAFKWAATIALTVIAALWYKSSVRFLIVGLLVGIAIVLEKTVLKRFFDNGPLLPRYLLTVVAGLLIGMIASAESLSGVKSLISGLFAVGGGKFITAEFKTVLLNNIFVFAAAFVFICTPFIGKIKAKFTAYSISSTEKYAKASVIKTVATALLLVICVIVVAAANIKL